MDKKEREILEKLYKSLLKLIKSKKDKIPIMNGINVDTDDEDTYIIYNFGSKSNYKLLKKLFDLAKKLDKRYELFDEGIRFTL